MQNASNQTTGPTSRFIKSTTMAVERSIETLTGLMHSWRFPILIVLSTIYFWTTAFRAEKKLYWFDEVFTVQLSTPVNLRHIWTALTHGADFNPPLMYLLTGLSQHVFGNTSLANRMPEIVAIWIFCLCLYWFTFRFAGAPGALTAFLFPLVTVAYWYSYEARPHALVLAFAGLAAVCWQRAQVGRHRSWWLIGLALSLGLTLLSHSFGIVIFFPIALAEILDSIAKRRFRLGAWVAMICGGSAILVSFALLQALKAEPAGLANRPGFTIIVRSYLFLLTPAAMVLGIAICVILMPWKKLLPARLAPLPARPLSDPSFGEITSAECGLIAGFVFVPLISFALAFAARAPIYTRYSLEAVFGFACLLGLAAARRPAFAILLPVILACQYTYDFGRFARHLRTEEPVTSVAIYANLKEYSERYNWMIGAGRPGLPIVLIDDLDSAPTIYYAPPQLQERMIFGWKGNGGINAHLYSRLIQYADAAGRVMPLDNVVRTYPAFFLFATDIESKIRQLQDNDILRELLPNVQTVTLLRAEGDMQLFFVQSRRL